MIEGLSKREKVLIFILVIIVLNFAAFSYVIIPSFNNYEDKLKEYDDFIFIKEETEIKIKNEENIRSNYDSALKRLNEIKMGYPVDITSEEVDRILTGLCMFNGLEPVSLGISDVKPYEVKEAKQGESGQAEQAARNTGDDIKTPAFSVVTASMNLSGTYDALKSIVNMVQNIEAVRINQVSYSRFLDTGRAGSPNITILFEITALNALQ